MVPPPFSSPQSMRIRRVVLTAAVPWIMLFSTEQVSAVGNEESGSVAIVSSVSGEARIARSTGTQQPDQPKFRGPIIYGDNLSTGKDSSLGLLVGQSSLLTMRELSEVRIADTTRNQQILEVAKGKVCLAVSRQGDAGTRPFTVRTPTSMITVTAGTLLSVEVEATPQKSGLQYDMKGVVFLAAMRIDASKEAPTSVVETYQVVEGSVSIVSLPSSPASVSLRAGQSLRVVGGVRGQPFVGPPVSCRAQEIQIIPVHTTTPPPAQQVIVQQQMQIAAVEPAPTTVAAMSQTAPASPSSAAMPAGLYVPYTDTLGQTAPTTIQITLPSQ